MKNSPTILRQGMVLWVGFTPLLSGVRDANWQTEVFGQYDLHKSGLAWVRMLRTNEWKLVRHYRTNGLDELYNLKNEPGKLTNLYGDPCIVTVCTPATAAR